MATAGLGWRQDPEASSRSPVWVPGAILCCFFQAIGRDLDQRWNCWVEPVRTWDASIAGRDFACYTMMPGLEIFSVYTIKEKFPFNLSKSIFLKFLIYKNSNWLSYTCQISNCKDSSSNPPCSLNDLKKNDHMCSSIGILLVRVGTTLWEAVEHHTLKLKKSCSSIWRFY